MTSPPGRATTGFAGYRYHGSSQLFTPFLSRIIPRFSYLSISAMFLTTYFNFITDHPITADTKKAGAISPGRKLFSMRFLVLIFQRWIAIRQTENIGVKLEFF